MSIKVIHTFVVVAALIGSGSSAAVSLNSTDMVLYDDTITMGSKLQHSNLRALKKKNKNKNMFEHDETKVRAKSKKAKSKKAKSRKSKKSKQQSVDDQIEFLNDIDVNNDMMIDHDEAEYALVDQLETIDEDDFDNVWNDIDEDGLGEVSYEDFMEYPSFAVAAMRSSKKYQRGYYILEKYFFPSTYLMGVQSSLPRMDAKDPVAANLVRKYAPIFFIPPCACTPVAMIGYKVPDWPRHFSVNPGVDVEVGGLGTEGVNEWTGCNHFKGANAIAVENNNPERWAARYYESSRYSNVYHRYSRSYSINGDVYEVHMYALYFEKDKTGGYSGVACTLEPLELWDETCGHRHDIESVLIWFKNDVPTYIGASAHGGYEVKRWSEVKKVGSRPHILYSQDTEANNFLFTVRRTHQLSFYYESLSDKDLCPSRDQIFGTDIFFFLSPSISRASHNMSPTVASWYYSGGSQNYDFRNTIETIKGSIISGHMVKDGRYADLVTAKGKDYLDAFPELKSIPFRFERSLGKGNCRNGNGKRYSFCSKKMSIIDCVAIAKKSGATATDHPAFQFTDDGTCEVLSRLGIAYTPTLCSMLNSADPTEGLWLEASNESAGWLVAGNVAKGPVVRADGDSSGKECFVTK